MHPSHHSPFIYEVVGPFGVVLRRWTAKHFVAPAERFTIDGNVYVSTYVSFHGRDRRQIVRIRVEQIDGP